MSFWNKYTFMCEQHAALAAALASSLANSQVAEGTKEISMIIIIKFPDRLKNLKRKINICFGPNLTAPCTHAPTVQNRQSNFIIKLALKITDTFHVIMRRTARKERKLESRIGDQEAFKFNLTSLKTLK